MFVVAGCGLQGSEEGLTEIISLLFGDSCGVNLQRQVWGSVVEREAAPVDIQCLHFVPVVTAELMPDILQEAGEGDGIGVIWGSQKQPFVRTLEGCEDDRQHRCH